MDYTIDIGLEVRAQLLTESKMFSRCGNNFGLPPNTQTDLVPFGVPRILSMLNPNATDWQIRRAGIE